MKLKIQDMRWENKSPYLFLEALEVNKCNNGGCREWHGVFGRDLVERKWIVTKSSKENWKGLKTDPVFAKHTIFATGVSCQQVARSSRQNTQRQNCEKFSKCFLRLEGLPTKGVASWAAKISVYPSRLDPSLANKSPKSTCERAAEACDLGDPRLSHQNRATLFLKFFSFCKNKILSKNT